MTDTGREGVQTEQGRAEPDWQVAGPGEHRRVRSIGLTGGIGSGKSTAAALFEECGAFVIDSDALAHQAAEDPEVLRQVGEKLGPELVRDGELDRERTGQLVFSDDEARHTLEGIIHPWVRARSRAIQARLLDSPDPPPLIVHDIPLLFENRLERSFDAVVVVDAPKDVRATRAAARSGIDEQTFAAREAAQLPLEEKAKRADYVLDNSGDVDELRSQVASLWLRLTRG